MEHPCIETHYLLYFHTLPRLFFWNPALRFFRLLLIPRVIRFAMSCSRWQNLGSALYGSAMNHIHDQTLKFPVQYSLATLLYNISLYLFYTSLDSMDDRKLCSFLPCCWTVSRKFSRKPVARVWNQSASLLSPNRGYPAWKRAHVIYLAVHRLKPR